MTTGVAFELRSTWALMRRAINEIARVPGGAIPGGPRADDLHAAGWPRCSAT